MKSLTKEKRYDMIDAFNSANEAFIAETRYGPSTFLMNIFFALRGSKRFILILDT